MHNSFSSLDARKAWLNEMIWYAFFELWIYSHTCSFHNHQEFGTYSYNQARCIWRVAYPFSVLIDLIVCHSMLLASY